MRENRDNWVDYVQYAHSDIADIERVRLTFSVIIITYI